MWKKWLKNQRGQAIVESAIVIPLILLLLLGMVEIGRVSNAYLTVTHAARHGARYGAVGASNEEILTRVLDASAPLNPADINVLIQPETGRAAGGDIQVRVTYPVELITPLAGSLISNPVVVSSVVTMRIE